MWSDLEEDTREVLSIEDRGQTHKQVRGRRDILSSHVLCLPTTPPPRLLQEALRRAGQRSWASG